MNSASNIDAAREYYDTHSAAEEIAAADLVPGDESNTSPMSGYSVRLPADVLEQARKLASDRGVTTGAWLRAAIENAVEASSNRADSVPVNDLLALVARYRSPTEAVTTETKSRDVPGVKWYGPTGMVDTFMVDMTATRSDHRRPAPDADEAHTAGKREVKVSGRTYSVRTGNRTTRLEADPLRTAGRRRRGKV